METMKTTIWKQQMKTPETVNLQYKLRLEPQPWWNSIREAIFNVPDKPIHGRVTCVLPRSFFLIQQEFKVVDPCLITSNSKTGGVRWTGTSVSEMPFDKQRAP